MKTEGFGHFEYVNGTVYEGQWIEEDGKKERHGEGRLIHAGTTVYEKGNEEYNGNWEHDKMEGYGVYKYTSGAVYSGEWHNNQHHGKGIYEFPDGSIYDGQWEHHKLQGEGMYIDREGTKWEGQFVQGVFQSKMQKILKNEKAILFKEQQVLQSVQGFFPRFLQAYQNSDKKTYKENLQQFFISGDEAGSFLKEGWQKYESQTVEKWAEVVQSVQEQGTGVVLRNNLQSTLIPPENILVQQLTGPGQLVQYTINNSIRKTVLVFIHIYEDNWLIAALSDTKK